MSGVSHLMGHFGNVKERFAGQIPDPMIAGGLILGGLGQERARAIGVSQ